MIRIDIQFAFLRGEYAQYDMSGLDLRLVRDWAVFTALSSARQGTNREAAWSRYLNNTGGTPLAELCKSKERKNVNKGKESERKSKGKEREKKRIQAKKERKKVKAKNGRKNVKAKPLLD